MVKTNTNTSVKTQLELQLEKFENDLITLNATKFKKEARIELFDVALVANDSIDHPVFYSYPKSRKELPQYENITKILSVITKNNLKKGVEKFEKKEERNEEISYPLITPLFDEVLQEQAINFLSSMKKRYNPQSNSKHKDFYKEIVALINVEKKREDFSKHIVGVIQEKTDEESKLEQENDELIKLQNQKLKSNRSEKKNINNQIRNLEDKIKDKKSEIEKLTNKIEKEETEIEDISSLTLNRKNNSLVGLELIEKIGAEFSLRNNDSIESEDLKLRSNKKSTLYELKYIYTDKSLTYLYACKGFHKTRRTEEDTPIYVAFIVVVGYGKQNFKRSAGNYLNVHGTSFRFQSMIKDLINRQVTTSYISKILKGKEEIRRIATRAAISQVMARNGSHNIGSHVLADYVTKLANAFYNFFTKEVFNFDKNRIVYNDEGNVTAVNIKNGEERNYQGLCINKQSAALNLEEKDSFKPYLERFRKKIMGLYNDKAFAAFIQVKRIKKIILGLDIEPLKNDENLNLLEKKALQITETGERSRELEFELNDVYHEISRKLQSRFSSYIKTRMDLQADIAATTPTLRTSKYLIKDVLRHFDDNRILLNRISGLENFEFFINVLIKTKGRCATKVGSICSCKGDLNHMDEDVLISMPNDLLGNHALYILLENIIRNSAKHGRHTDSSDVNLRGYEFTLEIREPQSPILSDLYEVYIYDSIFKQETDVDELSPSEKKKLKEKCAKYHEKGEHLDMNKVISIARSEKGFKSQDWDNPGAPCKIKQINRLIIDQNYRLNENIIQENNQPRPGSLGLIEMDVAATYLRNIPVERCDDPIFDIRTSSFLLPWKEEKHENYFGLNARQKSEDAYLLKAINIDRRLAYRFYLLKPLKILVITSSGLKNHISNENLNKFGIRIINIEEYNRNKGSESSEIYNHEFLLYTDRSLETSFEKEHYNGLLPYRKIFLTEQQLIPHFFKTNLDNAVDGHDNDLKSRDPKDEKIILEELERFAWLHWIAKQKKKTYQLKENKYRDFYSEPLKESYTSFEFEIKDKINGVFDLETELKKNNFFNNLAASTEKRPYKINFMDHGNKAEWEEVEDYDYAQPSSTITQMCLPNYSSEIDNPGYHLDWQQESIEANPNEYCQIIESCIHSIGIIDERIQAFSKEEYSKGLFFNMIFPEMNIFQPSIKLNDDFVEYINEKKDYEFGNPEMNLNLPEYTNELYDKLKYWFESHLKVLDTLIIHITILEKCLDFMKDEKIGDSKDDLIKGFIEKYIRKHNKEINLIFTSGRGKPELLPEDEKYLPFSIISRSLCEKKSKYTLMNAVVNARKLNRR